MEMKFKDLGKRVKKYRVERKLTQEALAEMAGVSPTHISHIENATAAPSMRLAIDIMNILQITPDQLLCGTADTAREQIIKESLDILKDWDREDLYRMNRYIETIRRTAYDV